METKIIDKLQLIKAKASRCLYTLAWVLLIAFSLFYNDLADYANDTIEANRNSEKLVVYRGPEDMPTTTDATYTRTEEIEKNYKNVNKVAIPMTIALMLFLADIVYMLTYTTVGSKWGRWNLFGIVAFLFIAILTMLIHCDTKWFIGAMFLVLGLMKLYNTPLAFTPDGGIPTNIPQGIIPTQDPQS